MAKANYVAAAKAGGVMTLVIGGIAFLVIGSFAWGKIVWDIFFGIILGLVVLAFVGGILFAIYYHTYRYFHPNYVRKNMKPGSFDAHYRWVYVDE